MRLPISYFDDHLNSIKWAKNAGGQKAILCLQERFPGLKLHTWEMLKRWGFQEMQSKRAFAWTDTVPKCLVVGRVKQRGSQNISSQEPPVELILIEEHFVLSIIWLEIRAVKWFPSPLAFFLIIFSSAMLCGPHVETNYKLQVHITGDKKRLQVRILKHV